MHYSKVCLTDLWSDYHRRPQQHPLKICPSDTAGSICNLISRAYSIFQESLIVLRTGVLSARRPTAAHTSQLIINE